MRWLALKARDFPLHERLRVSLPRERGPDFERHAAYDFGLDAQKFAYFAVSIAWRGAVREWPFPDGSVSTPVDMGRYQETARRYLVGEIGFPRDEMAVIVIVCKDAESRQVWGIPSDFQESGCNNVRFIARGVVFRLVLGSTMPDLLRDSSCVSAREPIYYADGSRRVKEGFGRLLATPLK